MGNPLFIKERGGFYIRQLNFFAKRPEVQTQSFFCQTARSTNPKFFVKRPEVQT
jgi:hypothetical protein